MDISARATSLTDRPQRAIRVTSVRTRSEDRTSISSHPLADLGWKLLIGLCHRFLLISRSSFVRAKGRSFVPARRASSRSDACIVGPRQFEGASFSQHRPGDTRQLVGKCDRKDIVMQPLLGRFDPTLEPIAPPGGLHLHERDPCRLYEQNPQITIAAPGYFTKDGAISSRDLLGN